MADIIQDNSVLVHVGEMKLVSSGIVHSTDISPLKISYRGLTYKFNFFTEGDGSNQKVQSSKSDEKGLNINIYNFTSPFGSGPERPRLVGTTSTMNIYLSFFVWVPGYDNGLRIISYSLYTADKS